MAPAEKFQHLLQVTRQRWENAIWHRGYTAQWSPSLTDKERELEMERWKNSIYEWSCKPYELSKKPPGKTRSAFEAYKVQLCGNKDLVQMLVEYPLHKSVNPVRWIESFLRSQGHIRKSPYYQKALRQSKKKTPQKKNLKLAAQHLRRKYTEAWHIDELLWSDWHA